MKQLLLSLVLVALLLGGWFRLQPSPLSANPVTEAGALTVAPATAEAPRQLPPPGLQLGDGPSDLVLRHQMGGLIGAVETEDGYAYVGMGPRLAILDLSDPSEPLLVGETEPLQGFVNAFVVAGDYVYVADTLYGLTIIDVSDPAEPFPVGGYAVPDPVWGIALDGNLVYLSTEAGQIFIFDVSDAGNPTQRAVYNSSGWMHDLAVIGDYLYVTRTDAALEIVNVTDPDNPVHSSFVAGVTVHYDSLGNKIAVAAGHVYIAAGHYGMYILNVSNPAAPGLVAILPEITFQVVIESDYAFAASGLDGLTVYDVTNPAAPTPIGEYAQFSGFAIAVFPSHVLVSDLHYALWTIDVSIPSLPVAAATYPIGTPTSSQIMAIDGNYLYTTTFDDLDEQLLTLEIYSLADPLYPALLHSEPLFFTQHAWGNIVVSGNYLYLTKSDHSLVIIDISDPLQPDFLGSYDAGRWTAQVAVFGSYAYFVRNADVLVIDVSNPSVPTLVATVTFPDLLFGITIADGYAYVVGYSLHILDLTDPAFPIIAGEYPSGFALDVAVADGFAYLPWNDVGGEALLILDVSDPSTPQPVGTSPHLGDFAYRIMVSGDYAYVITAGYNGYTANIHLIDVRDRANPVLLGSRGLGWAAFSLAAGNDYVYATVMGTGLFIFGNETPVESLTAANDSPTPLGERTRLRATAVGGAGATYTWDFGDGNSGSGAIVPHVYAAVGEYTAVVTATNSLSTVTATTTVRITQVESPGEGPENLVLHHQMGGLIGAVQAQHGYAYVGIGPRLTIFDLSDPSELHLVGETEPLQGFVNAFVVADDYVYVADHLFGLTIIDVSDPAEPFRLAGHVIPAPVWGIALDGNLAYLSTEEGQVYIFDVSDAANPVQRAVYNSAGWMRNLVVIGDYLYVTRTDAALEIVNVSDPDDPVHSSFFAGVVVPYNGLGSKIEVAGNHVYIAADYLGLYILNVSNPIAPVLVNTVPEAIYQVAIEGNHAFAASGGDGVAVYDVTNPANPTKIGENSDFYAVAIAVLPGHVLVSDFYYALWTLDVAMPSLPVSATVYPIEAPAYPLSIAIDGDYLFAKTYDGQLVSLEVYSLADPLYPALLRSAPLFHTQDPWGNIVVSGNYLYLVYLGYGLVIIDISDPLQPNTVGYYASPSAFQVAVFGSYAYTVRNDAVLVIDVTNPTAPTLVSTVTLPVWPYGITIADGYAYVVGNSLHILDLADPAFPVVVGEYPSGFALDVAVVGGLAYLPWDEASGAALLILDVSDPSAPQPVGTTPFLGDFAYRITVSGDYAYVITAGYYGYTTNIHLIDVRDPANPVLLGSRGLGWAAFSLIASNGYLYASDVATGLFIFGDETPVEALTAANNSPRPLGERTRLRATAVGGAGATYTWDFGDGNAGSGPIVPHVYAAVGEYTAVVTATNSLSTVTATTTVLVTDVPIAGLTAVNDSPVTLGESVNLTATIDAGTNVTYTWDLGDGQTAAGPTVSHLYVAVGEYTAVVTATNAAGSVTATTAVLVTDVPIAGLTAVNDSPVTLGETVHLTATISEGTNVTYTWDLGDGQTVMGAAVTHLYAAVCAYTAVVTATNSAGLLTATSTVFVVEVPITGLTAANDSPTPLGSVTQFAATISSGTNVTYTWDFGDGTTGSGAVVHHVYAAVGAYTAVVTVTNSAGAMTATTQVVIEDVPISGLLVTSDSPTPLGQATHFTATAGAGSNVSYSWDFGDDQSATGAAVTHVYEAPGSYSVTVTAQNGVGSQTAVLTVDVTQVLYRVYLPLVLRP